METDSPLFPYMENDRATFEWRGTSAPGLVGDFNRWDEENPLRLLETTPGVWRLTLELPPDAYIEYAYFDENGERVPDPYNYRRVHNGIDAYNHFFYMPAARRTDLIRRRPDAPTGEIIRQHLEDEFALVGGQRWISFYRPPVEAPTPLVLVYDGPDYKDRGYLVEIVDNLVAQDRMRPVSLAMIENGAQARFVEYACNDSTLAFIQERILPLSKDLLNLIDIEENPGAYGVMGASMGGLMALYTGMRIPQVFGRVLSQSGAFIEHSVIHDLVRWLPRQAVKIWMDIGTYDFLYEANRQMRPLLEKKGYDLTFVEYSGGHNYTAWRNDLWRGLETLFPAQVGATG